LFRVTEQSLPLPQRHVYTEGVGPPFPVLAPEVPHVRTPSPFDPSPQAVFMSTASVPDAVHKVAGILAQVEQTGVPCAPVRGQLAKGDISAAYAVQRVTIQRRVAAQGRRIVGRKIGLTSPAVQRQLGVDQPDFGALLSDMAVPDGGVVPAGRLLQPKIEAEVALVLGADLPHAETTVADVLRALRRADGRRQLLCREAQVGGGAGDLVALQQSHPRLHDAERAA
jgi:hypothetical protein